MDNKYEEIMEWASRRSIFYPSCEIYNGPAGFWNFGPYGETIRRKIIELWRKKFVQKENMLEIYGSQIMPDEVFKASGHLTSFNDPITQCIRCKNFYRADELIKKITGEDHPEATPIDELSKVIKRKNIRCPKCDSQLSNAKKYNLMVKTNIGVSNKECSLRPEACQTIFLDFNRMYKTMRITLPKGIAQVGRAFRNEISPRNSLFREIEFSQFEAEIFFNPKEINEIKNFEEIKDYKINLLRLDKKKIEKIKAKDLIKKEIVSGKLIAYYLARTQQLYEKYGIPLKKMRFREVSKNERPFYSKETWDFEVLTGLGWIEVIANNYRGEYDLKGHSEGSNKDLSVIENNEKFIPHIWEVSGGVDRTFYVVIDNAFKKEKVKKEKRIFLDLISELSPYDTAIFPLVNKDNLPEKSKEVAQMLKNAGFNILEDTKDSIGRRYRRLDECGLKYAITIDYDSIKNNDCTIRERNSMEQIRVKIKDLKEIFRKLIYQGIDFNKIKISSP
ncbi:MAG: glycine--tRNA ligase [Nanoarchaeota archaeon]|nr:glycine--tRNA ligase [Nanoarchaeota archaeon]